VKVDTIIVDGFLDNPDKVRQSILNIDYPVRGQFPGARSEHADPEYQNMIQEKIESILGFDVMFTVDSFRFQLCLSHDKTWMHVDESEWAGVLYLTPGAPINSGTGIFDKDENLITMIGNVYNRLVIYRGNLMHRSLIPGFGDSVESGRLTQVFFFKRKDKTV